jgi:hypothetical protein
MTILVLLDVDVTGANSVRRRSNFKASPTGADCALRSGVRWGKQAHCVSNSRQRGRKFGLQDRFAIHKSGYEVPHRQADLKAGLYEDPLSNVEADLQVGPRATLTSRSNR